MPDEQGPRRRFLVNELRRARAAAGLTQEDLGRAVNYSGSLVSAVENGHRPPTREYLAAVDAVLKTGGLFERMLAGPVTPDQAPMWFREWIYLERKATSIRCFHPLLVPGLLQTEAYAHAIFVGSGMQDPMRIDSFVATRMARQRILADPGHATYFSVLDEGVLARLVGSAAIMAAQCEHLLAQAALPNIEIRIIPRAAGAYAGLAGPVSIARGEDFEAVYLDNAWQAQTLETPSVVDHIVRRWEFIRGEALPRVASLEVMAKAAKAWRNGLSESFPATA